MSKAHRLSRPIRFSLQLNEEERAKLHRRAQDAGVSVSRYLRDGAIKGRLPQRVTPASVATYKELARIGNNVNQIARAANTALKMGLSVNIDPQELDEIKRVLMLVYDEVTGGDGG